MFTSHETVLWVHRDVRTGCGTIIRKIISHKLSRTVVVCIVTFYFYSGIRYKLTQFLLHLFQTYLLFTNISPPPPPPNLSSFLKYDSNIITFYCYSILFSKPIVKIC